MKTRDEPGGVSAATVRRRLSIVWGFFAFLQARGDVAANPAPRGLPTRRERSRPGQGVPLVRAVRRLPRILAPAEVDALMAALRTRLGAASGMPFTLASTAAPLIQLMWHYAGFTRNLPQCLRAHGKGTAA